MKLSRFRKRWFLLAMIGLGAFSFFAVRFVHDARESARAMSCENNLKSLVLGLHNYHSTFEQIPAAYLTDEKGRPIHSWRPMIAPFLGQQPDLYHWDIPWDSPKNRGFATNAPIWFENPEGKETAEEIRKSSEFDGKDYWLRLKSGWIQPPHYSMFHTCPCHDHQENFVIDYVAVTGEQTAWPDSKTISFKDITDSHDTTILLVEIDHSDILWSEPRDLRFDLLHFEINSKKGPSISSPHAQGPAIAFVDGSVARLSESIPPEIVKAMLTICGGEKLDKEEMRRKGWLR
jgi:Protein of unknown function (DUF1559)